MRSEGLAIVAAFGAATASWAQDSLSSSPILPKQITVDKISHAPVTPVDPMIGTDIEGRLLIDWGLAERLALSSVDPQRASLAKLMLAIRDGQWKAMPK